MKADRPPSIGARQFMRACASGRKLSQLSREESEIVPPVPSDLTKRILRQLGMRSMEELRKVFVFMLAAFLSNAFFVIARNVGTVLFLAHVGSEELTTAIFMSGVASIFVGQMFSVLSTGRSPAVVNSLLLGAATVAISGFYVASQAVPDGAPEDPRERLFVLVVFAGIYVAQDAFAMFVAMQCASVAQAAFSVADAKRLFGLVQLGNSIAAMTVGICIGQIAETLGTEQLLLLQVGLLLGSLFLNVYIGRHYVDPTGGPRKKRKPLQAVSGSGPPAAEPWWHNFLILAMGLWGFTVIFTKTMYEYQYNVLVAAALTPEEMVALTGYLYAGAGLASTAINLIGTKWCLEKLGMQGAILATPAALLSVSVAILVSPSIATTFAGRLMDLSLRWSLNNSVRTVLWIAVPPQQAAAAKPWVEGTVKKMGQAFNAVVITMALFVSGGQLSALSMLSLVFCSMLLVCCVRVYSLYLDSMWNRIKRRELQSDQIEWLPNDTNIDRRVMERLLHGGGASQIALLSQVGSGISTQFWEEFFARFHSFEPPVQVKILEVSRKQRLRVPDDWLLDLIGHSRVEPSVLQAAVLIAGDRRLHKSLEHLQGLLAHPKPSLRAAAAVSIIKIGWGVGLGYFSSAALLVLETMLGEPLQGLLRESSTGPLYAADRILRSRRVLTGGVGEADPEDLSEQVKAIGREWEEAIESMNVAQAVTLGIQITHLRSALVALRRHHAGPESLPAGPRRRSLMEWTPPPSPGSVMSQDHTLRADQAEEAAAALQMMQHLPDPRELISREGWIAFLCSDSAKVRSAALAMVREEDALPGGRGHQSVLKLAVHNLMFADTYAAAEAALFKFRCPDKVQEAVMEELRTRFDMHKGIVACRHLEDMSSSEHYADLSINMMHLLKFLRRQVAKLPEVEVEHLRASTTCDHLLHLSSDTFDADVLQELYATLADLHDRGLVLKRQLAEKRIYQVAEKLCQGYTVQAWVQQRCKTFTAAQVQVLRRHFQMSEAAGPDGGRPDVGLAKVSDQDIAAVVLRLASGYASEQMYLQKLQLLHLAVLAAPPVPMSYRSTRVLAAWRVLRSGDAASEAAVLEVLDSMLPVSLKGIVLPLLDSSPTEKKLSVAALLPSSSSKVLWNNSAAAPPWLDEWFRGSFSLLGVQLANMLSGTSRIRQGEKVPPRPADSSLLPKVFLLSQVDLYAGLLSIHLAELACVAAARFCPPGALNCDMGVTYIVAEGAFFLPRTGQALRTGDTLQALHSICKELPTVEAECTSAGGGWLLCISSRSLFDLMIRLTPKFALGILRNVVRLLPAPRSTGGSRMTRSPEPFGLQRPICGSFIEPLNLDGDPEPPEMVEGGRRYSQGSAGGASAAGLQGMALQSAAEVPEDIAELARQHEEQDAEKSESTDADAVSEVGRTKADESEETEASSSQDIRIDEEGVLTAARKVCTSRGSFSLLEKLMLLQEVKIFRYVPLEYLPDIAKCAEAVHTERGAQICIEGEPTNGTLYIVADGMLELLKDRGELQDAITPGGMKVEASERRTFLRMLKASDTLGNTGLLHDSVWPYSARALEDTWLLCIDRRQLTDALRGRRDLASAVIHGLYKTFTRRIKNAVFTEIAPRGTFM